MKQILEEEIKLRIDTSMYQHLLTQLQSHCGHGSFLQQENRFFDSEDRVLSQQFMSVRLRKQNQQLLVTIKRRQASDKLVHRQEECEFPINFALWHNCSALDTLIPLPDYCTRLLNGKHLNEIAGFKNQRWEFIDGAHHICLDKTTFNASQIEYELEIESSEIKQAEKKWLPLLKKWGCPQNAQTKSKLERCLIYSASGAL